MDTNNSNDRSAGELMELDEPREREPGFLTYQQREGLYTPETISDDYRAKFRHRLRKRIYNALCDFDYMRAIEPRDRRQIFDGLSDDPQLQDGLTWMLWFVYTGVKKDAGEDFETLLRDAVFKAEAHSGLQSGEFVTDIDIKIDVERQHIPQPSEAREKLERGEELAPEELGILLRSVDEDEAHDLLAKAHEQIPDSDED